MAQNNIEAYEGIINDKIDENKVLRFTAQQLQNSNDSIVRELAEVMKKSKIKPTKVSTAATQTQEINVTTNREIEEGIIYINTPSKEYTDTIQFNDETIVSYSIAEDSVSIGLDISNTQYLYTFGKKEWKNKKSLLKRIITLDFKKVLKYEYKIINSNDLIDMSNVRIIEISN